MTRAEALLKSAERREVAAREFRHELGLEGTIGVLGTTASDSHDVAVRAFRLGWEAARADMESHSDN